MRKLLGGALVALAVYSMALPMITMVQNMQAHIDLAYEQGHYDALKEAHDTYGLDVDFDGYRQEVKR